MDGFSLIWKVFGAIVVGGLIFVAIRELLCWYWKINRQIDILSSIEQKLSLLTGTESIIESLPPVDSPSPKAEPELISYNESFAGRLVFYDKGSNSDGWRYLEAAPASTEWVEKMWGGWGTSVGGTGTAIGTGKSNTEKILAKYGNAEPFTKKTDYAAKLCSDLVYGGFDDWFLPSKDELNQMYINLKKNEIGDLSGDNSYWSSSEASGNHAWHQYFFNGHQNNHLKDHEFKVRAVRAFL